MALFVPHLFILLSWWLYSLGESPTFFGSGNRVYDTGKNWEIFEREMSWSRSTITLIVQLLLHAAIKAVAQ
jgi:hypothetical protein